MKTLYNYIKESVLDNIDVAVNRMDNDLLETCKQWLDSKKISYTITTNNDIRLRESIVISEPIPKYINIKYVPSITFNSTDSLYGAIPEIIDKLYINDVVIENFNMFKDKELQLISIKDCDIRSLNGFPKKCGIVRIGDNRQHFNYKDIKKLVNTKYIYTLGRYESMHNCILLGKNDIDYIKQESDKLKNILIKEIPEIKSVKTSAREGSSCLWFRLDFLIDQDHPHNISDNSIYLDFKYSIDTLSLEKSQEGHLNLTPADKQGKYKYYALKGFSAPYLDNGGKKFRKTKVEDFNAKQIADKIIDWTKAVVKAALEDQGGELKR